jgi:hypothetical protein
MTKITRYRHAGACWLALLAGGISVPAATATGKNFETAPAIELNRLYEGSLPVGQGRHCYRVAVAPGQKVAIRGSNNYGTVFVSAYTGRGQLLIGETQILSSYQPTATVKTEASDGSVMVCVDSDIAQSAPNQSHRYSLQVALDSNAPTAAASPKPTVVAAQRPTTTQRATGLKPAQASVVLDREIRVPQPKTRKKEQRELNNSAYVNSPLMLAANSRSFDRRRDGGANGDAGNSFVKAQPVALGQMYGGFLNAAGQDDRDCYVYSDLPSGSQLQVAVANNDGILGISAYSEAGKILIGQTYIINQQGLLKTEATSGNVMVCMDTDGEKSDHQYTFSGQVR